MANTKKTPRKDKSQKSSPSQCTECGKTTSSKAAFVKHFTEKHAAEVTCLECSKCKKVTFRKDALRKHQLRCYEHEEKPDYEKIKISRTEFTKRQMGASKGQSTSHVSLDSDEETDESENPKTNSTTASPSKAIASTSQGAAAAEPGKIIATLTLGAADVVHLSASSDDDDDDSLFNERRPPPAMQIIEGTTGSPPKKSKETREETATKVTSSNDRMTRSKANGQGSKQQERPTSRATKKVVRSQSPDERRSRTASRERRRSVSKGKERPRSPRRDHHDERDHERERRDKDRSREKRKRSRSRDTSDYYRRYSRSPDYHRHYEDRSSDKRRRDSNSPSYYERYARDCMRWFQENLGYHPRAEEDRYHRSRYETYYDRERSRHDERPRSPERRSKKSPEHRKAPPSATITRPPSVEKQPLPRTTASTASTEAASASTPTASDTPATEEFQIPAVPAVTALPETTIFPLGPPPSLTRTGSVSSLASSTEHPDTARMKRQLAKQQAERAPPRYERPFEARPQSQPPPRYRAPPSSTVTTSRMTTPIMSHMRAHSMSSLTGIPDFAGHYVPNHTIRTRLGQMDFNAVVPIMQDPPPRVQYLRYGPDNWGPSEVNDNGIFALIPDTRTTGMGTVATWLPVRITDITSVDPALQWGAILTPQWSTSSIPGEVAAARVPPPGSLHPHSFVPRHTRQTTIGQQQRAATPGTSSDASYTVASEQPPTTRS